MDLATLVDLVIKSAEVGGVVLIALVLRPIKGLEKRAQEFDILFAKFGGKIDMLSGAIQKLESSIEHLPKVMTELAVIRAEVMSMKDRIQGLEEKFSQ